MLAKVHRARADGRSSVAQLQKYLDRNARADLRLVGQVESWESASDEILGVIRQNERCRQPLYHFTVSWREGERPTPDQVDDAVHLLIRDLGFGDHQWLAATHNDTENYHVHIVVNRVNPDDFRAHSPRLDYHTLAKTCRRLERKHGWTQDKGAYAMTPDGELVRTRRSDTDDSPSPSDGAMAVEERHGTESFQTWLGGEPARELASALEREPSWSTVHNVLRRFSCAYAIKGSGAIIFDLTDPGKVAKASQLGRWASLKQLEKRLGPYQAADDNPRASEEAASSGSTQRSYQDGRDYAERRAERPSDRAAERQALRVLYQQELRMYYGLVRERRSAERRQLAEEHRRRRADLRARQHTDRQTRLAQDWHGRFAERRAAVSIIAMEQLQQRDALAEELRRERQALRARQSAARALNWREWLQKQIDEGNERAEAARSELRGLRHRERRRAGKDKERRRHFEAANGAEGHHPLDSRHFFAAGVSSLGVTYHRLDGREAFFDDGRRLWMSDNSEETLRTAMKLAGLKWGGKIKVGGFNDEEKELLVRIAAKEGLSFVDADMQQRLAQYKACSNRHAERGASANDSAPKQEPFHGGGGIAKHM